MEKRYTKWRARGVNKKELAKIREKIRSKTKTILKQRHIKEYNKIIKDLYLDELNDRLIIYSKEEFKKSEYAKGVCHNTESIIERREKKK